MITLLLSQVFKLIYASLFNIPKANVVAIRMELGQN